MFFFYKKTNNLNILHITLNFVQNLIPRGLLQIIWNHMRKRPRLKNTVWASHSLFKFNFLEMAETFKSKYVLDLDINYYVEVMFMIKMSDCVSQKIVLKNYPVNWDKSEFFVFEYDIVVNQIWQNQLRDKPNKICKSVVVSTV